VIDSMGESGLWEMLCWPWLESMEKEKERLKLVCRGRLLLVWSEGGLV